MSVRARLTLWNVTVFTLALALMGLLLCVRVKVRLEAGIDRGLEQRARTMPSHIVPPPQENVERARANQAGQFLDLPPFYDLKGRNTLTGTLAVDREAVRRAIAFHEPVYSTVGDLRVYTVALPRKGPLEGVFQASESLMPVDEEVAKLTQTLITLLPAALIMTALGSLLLTERAMGPVREVTRTASEIEASDLSRRLPVAGRDEFARLAGTFNGMLGRLENAFAQQRQFVADASHELKTPLTVIKANTSLALAEPDLSPDTRETLTAIDGAADRTIRMVQDLLLLAKADADRLPFHKQRLDVRTLLETVAADAPKLRTSDATVVVKAAEGVSVVADLHYLRQLLTNLLDNALRHTLPNGRVTLYADRDATADYIVFRVRDTGTGIPPEQVVRLGERFYRADAGRGRREGGSGLGLAICRAIAEGHGGALKIESVLGEGTTVTAWFPIV